MIIKDSIDRLITSIDIVDVLGKYITLKKNGVNYTALCPFHEEKTPSFTVSKEKGIYKCFGCGKAGDAIEFVRDYQNKNFIEAVKEIAQQVNFSLEHEQPVKSYKKPEARTKKVSQRFIDHFMSDRCISKSTLERFGITESSEWMPKAQKEIPVICFNYFKGGELVNIKFRGAGKDFKLNSGSELVFYNIDALHGVKECVIVEGEIDCLSLHEAGIENVISVPNGASSGTNRLEYLDNCFQFFEGIEKIILFVDNDQPGYNLREELARRLGKHRCLKVDYPENCKDANNILQVYGKDKIRETVNNASQFPIEGVLTTEDIIDDIVNFYEHGYPKGFKAGISNFDNLLSFLPGQMTIITGIPGSGKS